jgi:hypothetical protein
MPRMDIKGPARPLTRSERTLTLLVQDLVNEVRVEVGMPPLTDHQVEQRLRELVRDDAKKERG